MFNNCITLVHGPGCYISWAWLSIADIGHLSPLGRRLLTARQSPEPESDQPRPPRATQLMLWYTTCRNLIKITNISFVMVNQNKCFVSPNIFNLMWTLSETKPTKYGIAKEIDFANNSRFDTSLLTVYKWNCTANYSYSFW